MEVDENVRKTFEGLKKRIVGIDKLTERQEKNERKIQKLEAEKVSVYQEIEKEKGEKEELKQLVENERKDHTKSNNEVKTELDDVRKDRELKIAEIESLKGRIESLQNNEMKEYETLTWELKAEISTLKQKTAANEEDYKLKNIAMKQLKQKQTIYETQIKEKDKKIKEYETMETEKDQVIKKSLERDKKLEKALDDIKKLNKEKEELKRVIVELRREKQELKRQKEGSIKVSNAKEVNDAQVIHEIPTVKDAQTLENENDVVIVAEMNSDIQVATKKKKEGSIFSLFSFKPKPTVVVRRKTPFLSLKKITQGAGQLPVVLQAPPPKRVPGVDSKLNLNSPMFDLLGNRYQVPSFSEDGTLTMAAKFEEDDFVNVSGSSMASASSQGPKRKVSIESPARSNKKLKLAPLPDQSVKEGVSLPKEISPIKSPGRLPQLGKGGSIPKTPVSCGRATKVPVSSTPMDHSTPSPKSAKKPVTPKEATTQDADASPKLLSPNLNTARARLVSSFNPNPAAIESVKSGSKLTAAQKEAAKMRMVGRAAPGVATRPSVNGFRASEPLIQTNKVKSSEDPPALKTKGSKARNKTNGIESLEPCPTRKSTQPSKMNSGVKVQKKSIVEDQEELGVKKEIPIEECHFNKDIAKPENIIEDPGTPTQDSSTSLEQRRRPPDHETPRQECKPIGDYSTVSQNKPMKITPVKTENRFDEVFGNSYNVHSKSDTVSETDKAQQVTSAENEPSVKVMESIAGVQPAERDRQDSVESLEDDLNLSDSYEDGGEQDEQCEQEVSVQSSEIRDDYMESDDDDDKPVNRRKRKFSEIEHDKDKIIPQKMDCDSEVINVQNKESDINESQTPKLKAVEVPKHLLGELLHNYKERQEDKDEKLKLKRENFAQEKASFARETFLQCLRNNFASYNNEAQNSGSFVKIIDGISTGNIETDQEAICDMVFEEIRNQPNTELTLDQVYEGQPPITRLEKRLFVLLDTLEKKKRFEGIMLRMGNLLSDGLFGKDHMYSLRMNMVCSFTRMFVLCMRRLNMVDRVKGLILDLLFFKSPRNHLIIGTCLMLFPSMFHLWDDPARHNPIEKTVAWMIFNTGVMAAEMHVNEVRSTFRTSYGYPINMGVKAADLVKEFMKLATEKATETVLLEHLTQCLLLIGKAHDYSWVNNNIVTRLGKLLGNITSNMYQDKAEVLRIWVMKTLGSLSRQYTVVEDNKDRTLMLQSFNGIKEMMEIRREDTTPELENAAVSSLVDHGHHLQYQIADFFTHWKPKHPLWPQTTRKIEDFFGTRGRKHAVTFKKSNCHENHDRNQVQVDDNVKTKPGVNEDIFVDRDDFSGGFDDKDCDMTEREPVDSPVGLNVGDMVYAMHQNDQQEFKKCKIIGKEINADGSTYQIRFEGSHIKSRTSSTTSTLAGTQLAYFDPTKSKLSEGTRCIAIFCEEPDDPGRFFAGIVAESSNDFNDNHYLIFFDDGYKAYLPLEDVREIVETLREVWKDGPCDPEFIQNYLEQFPNNPVLHLAVDELVETYLREDKVWVMARVLEVDASLAKMDFGEDYEPEWMYVGSPRFKLLSDNYNLKKEVIDDPSAVADIAYGEPPKTKKRIRTWRKCTGRGGKVPRQEIKNKPLRKTLNSQSKMLNEELDLEDDHF